MIKIKGSEIQKILPGLRWMMNNSRPFMRQGAIIAILVVLKPLSGVANAVASKYMVDYAVKGELWEAGIAAAFFGILMIANVGMDIWDTLISVRVSESISNALRQRLFDELMETKWMPLSSYHSGDLLTRLTSDIDAISHCLVRVLPGILSLSVRLVAAFLTLFQYDPQLAILAFLLGPTTVLLSGIWRRRLKNLNDRVKETESAYRSYLQESLQNLLIIKSFKLDKQSQETLQNLHANRLSWILKLNRATLTANTISSGGFTSGYFLAFVWGVYRLAHQAITFGTLTAFLQLVSQVQGPFNALARTFPQLISAAASAERLMDLEAMEKDKRGERLSPPKRVGIALRKISFSYEDGRPVLQGVDADIQPGEMVALVGTSGEGKTTLVRLLLALLHPHEGEVLFTDQAGHNYEASAATRDWLTYVPQGNTLFSGTIADNLRFGRLEATPEDMEKAARAAGAWGFIQRLPQGLETVIGENSMGLSEGQAQRIAIARSLLKDAPILVMDEATSALDLQTELHVLNTIKELGKDCTCLIITHRPSVRKICSRVFKLVEGKLTEV